MGIKGEINRVHIENCSSFRMKRKTLIPQPLLPNLGEGEPERSPSPKKGEGFRVRAKTTVLNIYEV
ncbi:hypothetical protein CDG77_28155 [Nostoc sp. 'Peltigera membranacea cyanobiont' 213]|nr:hypothetical protein CDG77_28155 [Nostoc sp. 'Peltigera membranacea cyanobiont' 213]